MTLVLTGPVVLDLGRGVKLRVEPLVEDMVAHGPAPKAPGPQGTEKAAMPAHLTEPATGGSESVQWFRSVWCEPQGHKHTDITETGCLIQALAALRGEDPALRDRLLASAAAYGRREAAPALRGRRAQKPAKP